MVIGNGMMAKAFINFKNDDTISIFASGVSNSKEQDPDAYQKELTMLDNLKNSSGTLIYFSSCSIFDDSLVGSMYIEHKKRMEKFIETNFENYWIFRLPNVIGRSRNMNTMINHFYNVLQNNSPFEVHENAFRYFIDVDDVQSIIEKIIKRRALHSGIYNLLYPHPYSVQHLVGLLEELINKKGNYKIKNKEGSLYKVTISEKLTPYTDFNTTNPEKYLTDTLQKYYSTKYI